MLEGMCLFYGKASTVSVKQDLRFVTSAWVEFLGEAHTASINDSFVCLYCFRSLTSF